MHRFNEIFGVDLHLSFSLFVCRMEGSVEEKEKGGKKGEEGEKRLTIHCSVR